MAAGQVSFKDPRKVKRYLVPQRENAIVNRLNKTRIEKTQPDLFQEKEDHLREIRKKEQAARQERVRVFFPIVLVSSPFVISGDMGKAYCWLELQKKEEARIAKERQEKKWQKEHAYDDIFNDDDYEATSNQNRPENWDEDFM